MKRQLILLIITLVPTIMLAQGVGGEIKRNVNQSENKRVVTTQQTKKSGTKQVTKQATLTVECPTKGAEIYINGSFKGKAPWSGKLPPGNYSVEARLKNHSNQREIVELVSNDDLTISLKALSSLTGWLSISYEPKDAEVLIDGVKANINSGSTLSVSAGKHFVQVRSNGYNPETKSVDVDGGKYATLRFTLQSKYASEIKHNINQLENMTDVTTQRKSKQETIQVTKPITQKETYTVKGVSFNMICVEGGTFMMGSNDSEADIDEKPVHQVTLSTYYIGETEVTQELWQAVMGNNPSLFNKSANLPVERVSWYDCQQFINKLNSLTGRKFRLPTEAEWEFAARGGVKSRGYKYSGSKTFNDVSWCKNNSAGKTHPVRSKQTNELGLYDMSGNVLEWCQNWYGRYSNIDLKNPTGPSSGTFRVIRGGSWDSQVRYCRVKYRCNFTPDSRSSLLGLRLAF